MAKIYANLIIAGRRTRDDITNPSLAESVGQILLAKGSITQSEYDSEWAVTKE